MQPSVHLFTFVVPRSHICQCIAAFKLFHISHWVDYKVVLCENIMSLCIQYEWQWTSKAVELVTLRFWTASSTSWFLWWVSCAKRVSTKQKKSKSVSKFTRVIKREGRRRRGMNAPDGWESCGNRKDNWNSETLFQPPISKFIGPLQKLFDTLVSSFAIPPSCRYSWPTSWHLLRRL
jgi:hypothetical protein